MQDFRILVRGKLFLQIFLCFGGGGGEGRIDKIFDTKEDDFFVVYGEKSHIDAYHSELLQGKVELIKLSGINTHGTMAFFPFDDINESYYLKLYNAIVRQQLNDVDMSFIDNQAEMMSFEEFKKVAIECRRLYFKKLFPMAVDNANVRLYKNEEFLDILKNKLSNSVKEAEQLKKMLSEKDRIISHMQTELELDHKKTIKEFAGELWILIISLFKKVKILKKGRCG
ncbi:hypothetical protein HCMG_00994 [Helicobacter canadensis MIT 98-5491]|nr:hypothetical protein HCMG_00994 [Helicobacter canadensis MIT 98-5491]